jgi:hypothetical protein
MAPPFKEYHKKVKESLILCEYLNPPEIRGYRCRPLRAPENPERTASAASNLKKSKRDISASLPPGNSGFLNSFLEVVKTILFNSRSFGDFATFSVEQRPPSVQLPIPS